MLLLLSCVAKTSASSALISANIARPLARITVNVVPDFVYFFFLFVPGHYFHTQPEPRQTMQFFFRVPSLWHAGHLTFVAALLTRSQNSVTFLEMSSDRPNVSPSRSVASITFFPCPLTRRIFYINSRITVTVLTFSNSLVLHQTVRMLTPPTPLQAGQVLPFTVLVPLQV